MDVPGTRSFTLTHLSLFSGIGGLDLAAEWAGFQTVGQCEWADYPTKVLEKHWPDVPRWRDIRTLTNESLYERTGLRTVDVISGGFPCQPFSVSGKRRGKDDDRYLWPEMLRVIQEIRPTWVVGENVAGIVNMALDTVLSDLEGLGYSVQALIIPACAVDAPHRRDRCAIVANCEGERERSISVQPRATRQADVDADRSGKIMADTQGEQDRRVQQRGFPPDIGAGRDAGSRHVAYTVSDRLEEPRLQGLQKESEVSAANLRWWPVEPDVGRVAHGVPHRVDKLRGLGNAVAPPQFFPIFKAIAEIQKEVY